MKGFNASPFSDCLKTKNHCFQVIHTPGHTDNHVVLLEEDKKWLFCGDMYVASRQKIAFIEENMAETIISLEKIAKLNFKHLFCAHSGIHHKGKEHILAKLDYFYKLREKIYALRKNGLSDDEINRIVFPKKRLITHRSTSFQRFKFSVSVRCFQYLFGMKFNWHFGFFLSGIAISFQYLCQIFLKAYSSSE